MFVTLENLNQRQNDKKALQRSVKLEGIRLYKFNGNEVDCYVKFYHWHEVFTERVIDKHYSNSEKLQFLKNYLTNDALKMVQDYHSGDQFRDAWNRLCTAFGNQSMLTRQAMPILLNIKPLNSSTNVKYIRDFINDLRSSTPILTHQGQHIIELWRAISHFSGSGY